MRLEEPLDCARRRHRSHADVKFLDSGSEIGKDGDKLDLRLGATVPRSVGEKIEKIDIPVNGTGQEESATAEGSQDRFGDARDAHGTERRVESVASFLQDGVGGTGGFGMAGSDCALWFHGFTRICDGQRTDEQRSAPGFGRRWWGSGSPPSLSIGLGAAVPLC